MSVSNKKDISKTVLSIEGLLLVKNFSEKEESNLKALLQAVPPFLEDGEEGSVVAHAFYRVGDCCSSIQYCHTGLKCKEISKYTKALMCTILALCFHKNGDTHEANRYFCVSLELAKVIFASINEEPEFMEKFWLIEMNIAELYGLMGEIAQKKYHSALAELVLSQYEEAQKVI